MYQHQIYVVIALNKRNAFEDKIQIFIKSILKCDCDLSILFKPCMPTLSSNLSKIIWFLLKYGILKSVIRPNDNMLFLWIQKALSLIGSVDSHWGLKIYFCY